MKEIERSGNELADLIPEVRQSEQRAVRQDQKQRDHAVDGKIKMRSNHASRTRHAGSARVLLNETSARLRLKTDLSERGFVLPDVVLQNTQQRLGLLRADIDAL